MWLVIDGINRTDVIDDNIDFSASLNDPIDTCDFSLDDLTQSIPLRTKMDVIVWDENAVPTYTVAGAAIPTIPAMNFLQNAHNFHLSPWATGGSLAGIIAIPNVFRFTMTFSNSTNGGTGYFTQTTLMKHVQPGVEYMLSGYFDCSVTLVNAQGFLQINWLDSSGSTISSVTQTYASTHPQVHEYISGIAPDGTVQAQIFYGGKTTNATNSGTLQWATVQFEPMWFTEQGVSYPTPDCNFDQVNSVLMPDTTTSRKCRIFAGYIEILDKSYEGTQRFYDVKCAGSSKLLENLGVVTASYAGVYDTFILNDIISGSPWSSYLSTGQQNKFAPTSTIIQGSLIDARSYPGNTLREVSNDLSDNSGSHFFVDPYYYYWYVPPSFTSQVLELSDAPDNITSFPYYDFSIQDDDSNPGNAILVRGTKQNAAAVTEKFNGDGSTKIFNLAQAPYTIQSVTVGGTDQKTGVDGVQTNGIGGYVALVNKQKQQLIFNTAPISGTNNIIIIYTFEDPVVVQAISADSIAQAGRPFVRLVNDTNLTSTIAAKNRGLAELNNYAYGRQTLTLSAMNIYVPPGSLFLFTCQAEGMSKKPFTVQTVESHLEGAGLYTWSYTAGVYSPSVIDHIRNTQKAIARPATTANVPVVVNTDVAISDSFHFTDAIIASLGPAGPYIYGDYGADTTGLDTPITYLELGDTSGTSAIDSSGHSHTGTYHGGFTLNQPSLLVSDSTPAVLFDGSSGYVSLPTTGLPTGANPFSIDCWFQPSIDLAGQNYPCPISYGTRGGNHEVLFWVNQSDGNLHFAVGTDDIDSGVSMLSGETYYAAGTYNGSTATLYLGIVSASSFGSVGSVSTTPNIIFSGPQSGAFVSFDVEQDFGWFPGIIGHAGFYSTALSGSRVLAKWNRALTVSTKYGFAVYS